MIKDFGRTWLLLRSGLGRCEPQRFRIAGPEASLSTTCISVVDQSDPVTAGFCIHLLMKAFDEQSSASRFVSSTLSVSRQLRSDDEAAVSRQVVDGRLQLSLQKK